MKTDIAWAMSARCGDSRAKAVLLEIAGGCDDAGVYRGTRAILAEHAGVSIRTVQRKLRILADRKLIKIDGLSFTIARGLS